MKENASTRKLLFWSFCRVIENNTRLNKITELMTLSPRPVNKGNFSLRVSPQSFCPLPVLCQLFNQSSLRSCSGQHKVLQRPLQRQKCKQNCTTTNERKRIKQWFKIVGGKRNKPEKATTSYPWPYFSSNLPINIILISLNWIWI